MLETNKEQISILRLNSVSLSNEITSNFLLKDISFEVYKGDFLGIIGASGAGKSTLLRLLNRLIDPSTGEIFFDNQAINSFSSTSLRQKIVLVPQEPKLLGMTVKQTLIYPLQLLKLTPAEIKSRLLTYIAKLNIPEEWLERNELQLSLGQRQFVAIARGLIMQPQILLLDEPTSALDMGKATFLLTILKELVDNHETTILMVSHQLNLLKNYVNRIVYLEKGELIEDNIISKIDLEKISNQLQSLQQQENENLDDF